MSARYALITSAIVSIFSTVAVAAELNEIRSTLNDQQSVAVSPQQTHLFRVDEIKNETKEGGEQSEDPP